jgi:hypothetical protein
MKKLLSVGAIAAIVLFGVILLSSSGNSERYQMEKAQANSFGTAVDTVSVPIISHFQERRTVARWAERWDKPSIATYVYLVSFGTVIGYYVADGKPASTKSFLVPEESYYSSGAVLSNPDIDGTYGDNNPGIRFFTAEGTAVEWAGSGATYIYSDAPLPINVPKLNKAK